MSLPYSDDPLGFGNVVFHHIPNKLAPGFQACLIVYAICTGVIALEIATNLVYDWNLARRKGWTELTKCLSRIAYFASRYSAFTFCVLSTTYLTTTGLDCGPYTIGVNVVCIIPLISVDFIFMQRTVAIFAWNRFVAVLLYGLFIIDFGLAIAAVTWFGTGYHIPNSKFCAYMPQIHQQPHASLFIAYCTVLIFLDTLILVLTCHKLMDRGIWGAPKALKRTLASTLTIRRDSKETVIGSESSSQEKISSLLIRQGLHYYVVLEITRLFFLLVYYTVSADASYQVMFAGVLASVGPVLAARLFRETSEFVRKATARSDQAVDDQQGSLPVTSSSSHRSSQLYRKPINYSAVDQKQQQQQQQESRLSGHYQRPSISGGRGGGRDGAAAAAGFNGGLKIYVDEQVSVSESFPYKDDELRSPAGLPRLHRQRNFSLDATPTTSNTLVDQRPYSDNLPPFGPSLSPPSQVATPNQVSEFITSRPQRSWSP